jgi:hypothetical protein
MGRVDYFFDWREDFEALEAFEQEELRDSWLLKLHWLSLP